MSAPNLSLTQDRQSRKPFKAASPKRASAGATTSSSASGEQGDPDYSTRHEFLHGLKGTSRRRFLMWPGTNLCYRLGRKGQPLPDVIISGRSGKEATAPNTTLALREYKVEPLITKTSPTGNHFRHLPLSKARPPRGLRAITTVGTGYFTIGLKRQPGLQSIWSRTSIWCPLGRR